MSHDRVSAVPRFIVVSTFVSQFLSVRLNWGPASDLIRNEPLQDSFESGSSRPARTAATAVNGLNVEAGANSPSTVRSKYGLLAAGRP